jgi:hypothetical protein
VEVPEKALEHARFGFFGQAVRANVIETLGRLVTT